jgi:hypothetical protein
VKDFNPFEIKDFKNWVHDFIAFRERAHKITRSPLPLTIGKLQEEAADIVTLEDEGGEHASMGEACYQKRKGEEMDALKLAEWPKSAIEGYAKTKCFAEIFYRNSSMELLNSIRGRAIKNATFQKNMRP